MTYNYYALKEATLASNVTASSNTIKIKNLSYATRNGEVTLKAGTLNMILDAGTDTREFARVVLSTDVTTVNNSLTFTNIVRNVSPTSVDIYAGTDTGTTGYAHGAGARVMVSPANTQHFGEFAVKKNAETIDGDWNFTGQTSFAVPPTSPNNVDASSSVKGVSKLSVAPVSSTEPIAVGSNDPRVPKELILSSAGAADVGKTPKLDSNGKIDESMIPTTKTKFSASTGSFSAISIPKYVGVSSIDINNVPLELNTIQSTTVGGPTGSNTAEAGLNGNYDGGFYGLAQSFMVPAGFNSLVSVKVRYRYSSSPGGFTTLTVRSALGGAVLISVGSVGTTNTNFAEYELVCPQNLLVSGQTYYLEFSPFSSGGNGRVGYNTGNVYSDGRMYTFNGTVWSESVGNDLSVSFSFNTSKNITIAKTGTYLVELEARSSSFNAGEEISIVKNSNTPIVSIIPASTNTSGISNTSVMLSLTANDYLAIKTSSGSTSFSNSSIKIIEL